jgi:uroporphyrin-III C-methyltransferase
MNSVYLVGAGPGNPDLITLKGLKVLKKADVVLYDRLVDKRILKMIPKGVKKIPVGKIKGEDSDEKQKEIFELIKKYYYQGKNVVRLKGGDPFVFGRGGEEIEFMKENGIRFSVIPGISSSLGVPTSIGLPLTHRNYSSSILIIPGHLKKGNEPNWKVVADFDGTIVILMGASKIEEISSKLIELGKDPETPVCAIMDGTTKNETVIISRLNEIKNVKAPAVIVIGKVVKLIEKDITSSPGRKKGRIKD